MNAKKYLLSLAAAAAVAVCMTGCGDSDDSSANSGTVSMTTTTPAAGSEADTTTTAPAEDTPDDTMTTTGTQEAPESSEEGADDSREAPAADGLAAAARISYNGCELGVGDNLNEIKDKLGDEAGPSQKIESCMTGNPEIVYYYKNINIHTSTEGIIYSIDLGMDALYEGGEGSTKDGVKIGSTFEEAKALLGEPTNTDDYNYFYEEGTLKLQLSASYEDDSTIGAISVTDASFN